MGATAMAATPTSQRRCEGAASGSRPTVPLHLTAAPARPPHSSNQIAFKVDPSTARPSASCAVLAAGDPASQAPAGSRGLPRAGGGDVWGYPGERPSPPSPHCPLLSGALPAPVLPVLVTHSCVRGYTVGGSLRVHAYLPASYLHTHLRPPQDEEEGGSQKDEVWSPRLQQQQLKRRRRRRKASSSDGGGSSSSSSSDDESSSSSGDDSDDGSSSSSSSSDSSSSSSSDDDEKEGATETLGMAEGGDKGASCGGDAGQGGDVGGSSKSKGKAAKCKQGVVGPALKGESGEGGSAKPRAHKPKCASKQPSEQRSAAAEGQAAEGAAAQEQQEAEPPAAAAAAAAAGGVASAMAADAVAGKKRARSVSLPPEQPQQRQVPERAADGEAGEESVPQQQQLEQPVPKRLRVDGEEAAALASPIDV